MLKMKSMRVVMSVLVLAAMLLSGCAGEGSESQVAGEGAGESQAGSDGAVKVAFIGPLTGSGSADLILASKGAQLAVDQRNAAGGVCGGRTVELVLEDDKADPKEAANVATKLTGDGDVLAVAHGWNSSAVLAAAPIFNEAGLSQVDYYGVAPSIREAGPYTFRVIPTGELMAQYIADWVVKVDGHLRVASFYENTDYGKSLYDVFSAEIEALGGEIVASEAVLMDQKDFSAVIVKFKAAEPDAVVMFGQYEAAAFWQIQSPDVGFSAPLYGSDGIFAPELINLAGEAANGIRSVSAYTVDSQIPFVAEFVSQFRDAYGTDPNNGGGYAYDTLLVILDALEGGNCTRGGVKDYLTNDIKDVQGVTGMISFDEEGDRMFQEGLYIKLAVEDGKFVEYSK